VLAREPFALKEGGMAASANPKAVTVSRDHLFDLIAALDAAGDVFYELNGADHPAGAFFSSEAWRLLAATLGGGPAVDDDWETDPNVVEIYARSSIMEAEALSRCAFEGRIATLRAMADPRRTPSSSSRPRQGACSAPGTSPAADSTRHSSGPTWASCDSTISATRSPHCS
jgi:hypothetical protein